MNFNLEGFTLTKPDIMDTTGWDKDYNPLLNGEQMEILIRICDKIGDEMIEQLFPDENDSQHCEIMLSLHDILGELKHHRGR